MRFLLPVGGVADRRFGILTAPNHRGIPLGIADGLDWAADMGCHDGPGWVKRFDDNDALPWLWDTMRSYHHTCLFITVPDVVGDAMATLAIWQEYTMRLVDWPLAYCAQDGAEDLPFPTVPDFGTVFIGGSTEWKLSDACRSVIVRGQEQGKCIHIGRVNWWKRYRHFRGMGGSDEWTCDGTRMRFDGTDNSIEAWAEYMVRPYQIHLDLPTGNYCS